MLNKNGVIVSAVLFCGWMAANNVGHAIWALKYFFVAQSTTYVFDRKEIPDEVVKRNLRLKRALMLINVLLPIAFAIFLIVVDVDLAESIKTEHDIKTLVIVVSFLSAIYFLAALNSFILYWSGTKICKLLPECRLKVTISKTKARLHATASILSAFGLTGFLIAYFLDLLGTQNFLIVFLLFTLCNLLCILEQSLNMFVVFRLIKNKAGIADLTLEPERDNSLAD